MQKVFIDTSCYLGFGLNFSNKALLQLIRLMKEGHIQILTSYTILEELKQNIAKSKAKALKTIKTIKKEYVIKNNVPNIEAFEKDIENIEENIFEKLKECNLKDIDIKEINVQDIMRDYFKIKPPFSENENKKFEFPDAIVLHSILKYLNGDTCYIISEDNDWKNFCSLHTNLIFYDCLSSFIDKHIINENPDNKIFEKLKQDIFADKIYLKEIVEECFDSQIFFHDESTIAEPDVELKEIKNVKPKDLYIIFYDENNKIIEVELYVNIDFEVAISGYDASAWHKDDETKEIFYIKGVDDAEITTNESIEKRINATIRYDNELNFEIESYTMDSEIILVGNQDCFC